LFDLNKLSKITTSLKILNPTPVLVKGAGMVGIFKGAGVFVY
jgi:hypothetical protein